MSTARVLRSLCPKGRHIFWAKRYPLSAILQARFSPGPVVHKLCDRRGGEWQFFSIAGFAHRARKIKFGRMPPFRFGDGKKYLPFSVSTYLLLSMKHTKASILTPSPPRYIHTMDSNTTAEPKDDICADRFHPLGFSSPIYFHSIPFRLCQMSNVLCCQLPKHLSKQKKNALGSKHSQSVMYFVWFDCVAFGG